MLARGRLKIKPNISKGSKSSKKTEGLNNEGGDIKLVKNAIINADANPLLPPSVDCPVSDGSDPNKLPVTNELSVVISSVSPTVSPTVSDQPSPRKRLAPILKDSIIPRTRLTSTCEAPRPQNRKKKFRGDEVLDTKKMRMMDMIYWNPKNEKGLMRLKELDVTATNVSTTKPEVITPAKVAAPQVKVGPDGKLILDETSLYISETQQDSSMWETIDEDRLSRKVTSLSFRNRLWRKGTAWTKKEDELFYELLRCTGTDFGLMHQFFPSRARNELKSKFNREERTNWDKMKEVMSLPAVFDETLRDRAEALAKEIEFEAEEKKKKKEKSIRFHKRERSIAESEEWNESTADLVGEAEEIINALQREDNTINNIRSDDESSSEHSPPPSTEKRKTRANKNKPISASAKRILDASRKAVNKSPISVKKSKPKGYEEVDIDSISVDSNEDAIIEITIPNV